MKLIVIENSSKRLALRFSSSVLIYGFFGLLTLFGGVFVMHILGVSTSITVEEGMMSYRENRLLVGDKEWAKPVSSVSEATIILEEGFGKSYEVAIKVGDGLQKVALPFSDGDAKRAIADGLNAAMADPKGTYTHSESALGIALIFGGVLMVGGLLSLYLVQTVDLVCDTESGEIKVRRKHWIFPITHETPAKIEDFRRADSKEFRVGNRLGGSAVSYKVFLEMKGGDTIPVGLGPMFRERDADHAVSEINRWFKRRKKSRR